MRKPKLAASTADGQFVATGFSGNGMTLGTLGAMMDCDAVFHRWDCPCHGFRFQASGEVLAGPAETPLAPHDAAVSASHHAR